MSEDHCCIDYSSEYKRLCEANQKLNTQYEECLVRLEEKEKQIAFLEGQIKAFEFCVSKGCKQ